MTLEQQMKSALDGNFWFFIPDGKIECRKVSPNHIPNHDVAYRMPPKPQAEKVRLSSRPLNPNRWSAQNSAWLKAFYKLKTIRECADELGKPYHTVYKKITALRWKELDGK